MAIGAAPYAADACSLGTRAYLARARYASTRSKILGGLPDRRLRTRSRAHAVARQQTRMEFAPLRAIRPAAKWSVRAASTNDLIVSLIADWIRRQDGLRRGAAWGDGTEKWTAKSYEIAAGRLLVAGEIIYALGSTSEHAPFLLCRSFDRMEICAGEAL